MENLKGALIFGQSGGPTSVINASAYGVFDEALKSERITKVYGALHGIKGILDDRLVDIGAEDAQELKLLMNTPSSALGSARYKMASAETDEKDYKRILEIFKKYDVRYFFFNGGNDSMDTCNKVSKYLQKHNYACNVIGVPKTIDNDLCGTDHCPGYGSAAKYIATSCMEIALDSTVYDKGAVTIIEIMGRNAGWLTAASAIASYKGKGPDLIYVPENTFDVDAFVADVKKVFEKNNNCIVAISEGIHDASGKYINEYAAAAERDSFNHAQLGGACTYLAAVVKEKLKVKVRPIEFSLMQRCAAHVASQTDVDEAVAAGRAAVIAALSGSTDKMIAFKRSDNKGQYKCEYFELPLEQVANAERKLPAEYITADKKFITEKFLDYVMPLIQGEARPPFVNGIPKFANLKKHLLNNFR